VILGDLLDHLIANAPSTAITDMTEQQVIADDDDRCGSGPHPLALGRVAGLRQDAVVGSVEGVEEQIEVG